MAQFLAVNLRAGRLRTTAACRHHVLADKADAEAGCWRQQRRVHCHAKAMNDSAASAAPLQKAMARFWVRRDGKLPQRRGFLTVPD